MEAKAAVIYEKGAKVVCTIDLSWPQPANVVKRPSDVEKNCYSFHPDCSMFTLRLMNLLICHLLMLVGLLLSIRIQCTLRFTRNISP